MLTYLPILLVMAHCCFIFMFQQAKKSGKKRLSTAEKLSIESQAIIVST